MIEIRTGQAGLAPLAAVLGTDHTAHGVTDCVTDRTRATVFVVPVSQNLRRDHRVVHPRPVCRCTGGDPVRPRGLVLTAAGETIPEQLSGPDRWRLLRQYLPGGDLAEIGRAFDDARLDRLAPRKSRSMQRPPARQRGWRLRIAWMAGLPYCATITSQTARVCCAQPCQPHEVPQLCAGGGPQQIFWLLQTQTGCPSPRNKCSHPC